MFWLGIWEQGRVEFDSGVFPYTQPEQPRVEFCLIVLRIEENITPIDIQLIVNLIPIVIQSTTNECQLTNYLSLI